MIQDTDKLLIGRDETSYHINLADTGLAKISYVDNVAANVVTNLTDITDRIETDVDDIESKFVFSNTEVAIDPEKNFKVGDDDLFVNVGNNHVGIGTHNPQKSLDVVSNDTANRATVRVSQYSDDNKGPWFNLTKGRGTVTNKKTLQYNDVVGEVYFTGWTGSNKTLGTIRCTNMSSNNEGYGKFTFKTNGPDGLKSRLYTQIGGEVVVTKGLILNTEDTAEETGTFSMRDFTNNANALSVNFTKYRGNNPTDAVDEGGVIPAANLDDRLLPDDGVVRLAFGGWDGAQRKNLAVFKVDCFDDNLTGIVTLSSKKIGVHDAAERIRIDENGDTHIRNGNLVINNGLIVANTQVSPAELSRLSGLSRNAQVQFDELNEYVSLGNFNLGIIPPSPDIQSALQALETAVADRATNTEVEEIEVKVENLSSGINSTSFTFSTSTNSGPSKGSVRFDNSTPSAVTKVYLSETNRAGVDLSNVIPEILFEGSRIYLQTENDASEYFIATVTALSDSGDYYELDVTDIDAGSRPKNNAKVIFAVVGRQPTDEMVPLSTLKSITAASSDFADFQSRIAAL